MKLQIISERIVIYILVLFCIQASIIAHLNIFQCINYILAQILIILVPGLVLYDFFKPNSKDKLSRIFMSYAIGYALSIFIYFLFLFWGIQSHIQYFYYPFAILCIIILIRDRQTFSTVNRAQGEMSVNRESLWIVSVLLTLAFLIGVFGYQCNNLSPLYHENSFAWGDLNFYERNTVAATMQFPLPDLSINGSILHYHYFSSLHGAFMHFITKVEIFDLCYMAYLEFLFLLVGAAYVLSSYMLNNKWLVFISVIFIVFTAGFEDKTDFYYSKTFLCSFGMTEALAMGMFSMCVYINLYKKADIDVAHLLLGLLLFSACIGLKALVGCVVLVGIAIGCILLLFNKQYKKAFLYGLSYLFVFLCIYIVFLHSPQVEPDSTRSLTFSATDTIFHSGYFELFYISLLGFLRIPFIPYIITLVYYLFLALFPAFLLSLFVMFYRRWNDYTTSNKDSTNFIFLCMFLTSLLLGLYVSQAGLSQTYFIRAGLPFLFVLLLKTIERRDVSKAAIIVVCSIACLGTYKSLRLLLPICHNGINKIFTKNSEIYDFGGLTKNELLGLRWIRDNIDPKAIIATNKMIEDEKDELGRSRSFATSTYSEHQVYVEGTEFSYISKFESSRRYKLMKLVCGGDIAAISTIKSENVSYLVLFKSVEGYREIARESIFENDALVVYKL